MTTVKMVSLPTSPLLSPERDSSDSSDSSGGYSAAAAMMDGACPPVLLLQSVLGIILASPKAVPESSLRRIDVMLSHLAAAVKKRIPGNGNGNGSHGGNGISKGLPTECDLKKTAYPYAGDCVLSRKNVEHPKRNGVLFPDLYTTGHLSLLPHPGPCQPAPTGSSPNSPSTVPSVAFIRLPPHFPLMSSPQPQLTRPPVPPPRPPLPRNFGGWAPIHDRNIPMTVAPPTTAAQAAGAALPLPHPNGAAHWTTVQLQHASPMAVGTGTTSAVVPQQPQLLLQALGGAALQAAPRTV
eukprot:RCo004925